jgi:hypothetical protein
MINGAHVVVYSFDPDADRVFFQNILGFPSVDAGHGWLIFALPAAESAFHPAEENNRHELYLMCDDVQTEMAALRAKGVECREVTEARWGSITKIRLPGGGEIGLYEPKHPRPIRVESRTVDDNAEDFNLGGRGHKSLVKKSGVSIRGR